MHGAPPAVHTCQRDGLVQHGGQAVHKGHPQDGACAAARQRAGRHVQSRHVAPGARVLSELSRCMQSRTACQKGYARLVPATRRRPDWAIQGACPTLKQLWPQVEHRAHGQPAAGREMALKGGGASAALALWETPEPRRAATAAGTPSLCLPHPLALRLPSPRPSRSSACTSSARTACRQCGAVASPRRAALDAQLVGRGVLVCHQVLGARNEVGEGVLLVQVLAVLVPAPPHFACSKGRGMQVGKSAGQQRRSAMASKRRCALLWGLHPRPARRRDTSTAWVAKQQGNKVEVPGGRKRRGTADAAGRRTSAAHVCNGKRDAAVDKREPGGAEVRVVWHLVAAGCVGQGKGGLGVGMHGQGRSWIEWGSWPSKSAHLYPAYSRTSSTNIHLYPGLPRHARRGLPRSVRQQPLSSRLP